MPSRRTVLSAPAALAALAHPAFAAGKNKKRKKSKSNRKSNKKSKSNRASQADSTLPILSDLAMHHVHSWRDEGRPIPELVAKYRAGEILHVICGSISAVGVQVLRDAGYQARVVGVVTQQPFNGVDGHIMLEVWQQGAWRLYDIDGNRRAVDSALRGVSIVTQVEAGTSRLWQSIADDPRAAPEEDVDQEADWTQAALDQRVFGTPWILLESQNEAFHDDTDRTRLEAMGHVYLQKEVWHRLLAKP